MLGMVAEHLECHHIHIQDNQGIRLRQNGFVKGKSCLTSPACFYSKMTPLVDEGERDALVKLLIPFPQLSSEETGCLWLGQVHCVDVQAQTW